MVSFLPLPKFLLICASIQVLAYIAIRCVQGLLLFRRDPTGKASSGFIYKGTYRFTRYIKCRKIFWGYWTHALFIFSLTAVDTSLVEIWERPVCWGRRWRALGDRMQRTLKGGCCWHYAMSNSCGWNPMHETETPEKQERRGGQSLKTGKHCCALIGAPTNQILMKHSWSVCVWDLLNL